ncbi:MAG: PqqD family peptide modification chaperone [Thermodesulfobacteriota bacterium]
MKKRDKEKNSLLNRSVVKKQKAYIAWRIIAGQAVIVNLQMGIFNVLNPVATRIWELADGQMGIEEISQRIYQEFEISRNTARIDCLELINQLLSKGLVTLFPAQERNEEEQQEWDEYDKELFKTLREKVVEKKIPLMSHFDLTYHCNLRCAHCYIVSEDRPELRTSEIKDILDQLAKAGTLYLTLSGGELMTRKDFFEIAFYARELDFALRLLTNGILIDEKTADKIALLHPELVAISIYSINPKVHDGITKVSGAFQKSLAAAKMLKERGVRLKISTVIIRQNIKDWHSIYQLAQELGAQFQADYRIAPKSNGNKYPLRFHIDDIYLPSLLANPIFTKETDLDLQERGYTSIFDTIPCGAGHMSCYISPYGDIYPCVQLPINCGNLRQKLFTEIWENSSELLQFRSITLSQLPKCFECTFFQYCRLCIGLNYVEEGDMFLPSKRACKEAELMETLGVRRR